jgi:hypothetical protein
VQDAPITVIGKAKALPLINADERGSGTGKIRVSTPELNLAKSLFFGDEVGEGGYAHPLSSLLGLSASPEGMDE